MPKLSPDPRYAYRQDDVPAASHPPLAACMARLAGKWEGEVVWDPFCGSGLELVERARLGQVKKVIGSDRSNEAVTIAMANFAAAKLPGVQSQFIHCDLSETDGIDGMKPSSVTLVISNPPLGRRVTIPNLRGLIEDFFNVALIALKPGGRLVFVNPVAAATVPVGLRLESRQLVDMGGFDCRMEKYVRLASKRV